MLQIRLSKNLCEEVQAIERKFKSVKSKSKRKGRTPGKLFETQSFGTYSGSESSIAYTDLQFLCVSLLVFRYIRNLGESVQRRLINTHTKKFLLLQRNGVTSFSLETTSYSYVIKTDFYVTF